MLFCPLSEAAWFPTHGHKCACTSNPTPSRQNQEPQTSFRGQTKNRKCKITKNVADASDRAETGDAFGFLARFLRQPGSQLMVTNVHALPNQHPAGEIRSHKLASETKTKTKNAKSPQMMLMHLTEQKQEMHFASWPAF